MTKEIIFLGHDNTVDLLLKAEGNATEATFTNGSDTVDGVVGIVLASAYHLNQYFIAPDNQRYKIIDVPLSGNIDAFKLDRAYIGPTVSGSNGAFKIDIAAPIDLSSVTKITATFMDGTYIESTDNESGLITWAVTGYQTGEIRIDVGDQSIKPGEHKEVPIIVYDAVKTNGLLWGYVDFEVVKDPEGSS